MGSRSSSEITSKPIGIFDSGVGGLTVVRAVMRELPNESIVYFGDTARVPYGNKSTATIRRFAAEIVELLIEEGVKLIVIACNTVASNAREYLMDNYSVKFVDVIAPTVEAAIRVTKGKIGVIGTKATIGSGCYMRLIKKLAPNVEVIQKPTPLLVPFIEERHYNHTLDTLLEDYLRELRDAKIDTLLLGCTHYPLIKERIERIIGDEVVVIDSSHYTAKKVKAILQQHSMVNETAKPSHKFYFSDIPVDLPKLAHDFLGIEIEPYLKVLD